ncbi:hypothetical protein HWV62_34705 [Athelia sp. TMB]|nr:hypothetical protein HWV62_34705 [Athelia sp. TMB]
MYTTTNITVARILHCGKRARVSVQGALNVIFDVKYTWQRIGGVGRPEWKTRNAYDRYLNDYGTIHRSSFSARHAYGIEREYAYTGCNCVSLFAPGKAFNTLSAHTYLPKFKTHTPLNSCYPPSSALVSSGPQYSPNSQELSRLTYYASNRPGKINKLGSELEKRIKIESRKAQVGNTRSKASLLIGLAIFQALTNECRRDVSLLSPSLIASLSATLAALSSDLEVTARTANVFAAWATYTDGSLIGVDNEVTQGYISILSAFASLASAETKDKDHEFRNRTRLVGLSALASVVNSEALYHASSHFKTQVSIIIRPLLVTLLYADVAILEQQSTTVKDKIKSTYLAEFRTRPAMERRAASIHVHVDGETGPATTDVISGCLRTWSSLLQHANGWQLGQIMRALADNLDETKGWERLDQCRWLAGKICEWTQYQYRYAVPTRLVEHLLESQDAASTTALQSSLAAMVTTIFTSPTPLINLSTSDIISNLMQLIMHRIAVNSEDALLPELVECIASLGMHVYYSDQIQDLAAELISRLINVELQGVVGSSSESRTKNRSQAIRCLLAGLLGLMQAADKDGRVHGDSDGTTKVATIPSTPPLGTAAAQDLHNRPSRRTRVSPEVWLDTLSLLCDADYAVRADYADAFVFYLRKEIRKRGDSTDSDGVKRIRPLAEGPIQQATQMKLLTHGDPATRALHAAHGYLYVLATASSLGFDPSTRASSAATTQTHDTNALAGIPGESNLPFIPIDKKGSLAITPEPILFTPAEAKPNFSWSGISSQNALMAIISNQNVQEATGLDRPGLLRRFSMKWTPESALKDCLSRRAAIERPSNYDTLRGDGISPLLKISPALMNVDNISLHSLARSTRGVGVTDLREALEGRNSMSNPTLGKTPSFSTLEHAASVGDHINGRGTIRPVSTSTAKRRKSNANGADDNALIEGGLAGSLGDEVLNAFSMLQK